MAYSGIPGWNPPKPDGKQDTYPAAIQQGGQDYDDIMKRYREFLDRPNQDLAKLRAQYEQQSGSYTPTMLNYNRGADLDKSIKQLEELSRTGGLSSSEQAELRARGISPIRSVYANAQQNLSRQKALQGGYSPNYTAASSKMAREGSEAIAGQVTNVNAGIAEMTRAGRLAIAPQLAALLERERGAKTDIDRTNADAGYKAYLANLERVNAGRSGLASLYGNEQAQKLQALSGMNQTYGTTPANAQLYGNQALQQQQANQNQQQINQQGQQGLINQYGQGGYRPPTNTYRPPTNPWRGW